MQYLLFFFNAKGKLTKSRRRSAKSGEGDENVCVHVCVSKCGGVSSHGLGLANG